MREKITVEPGSRVDLSTFDPSKTLGLRRASVEKRREALFEEIADLQELLYAAGEHALLIILQGTDSSGKDGTIKNVMDPVNPIGVRVTPFKVPSDEEREHDFLWRVHKATPRKGMIALFNRSHYEDVVVVRVHELVPRTVWMKRYRQINDFERLLVDSNTIVLKFFLHISKKEQEQRLLEREEEVEKAWKLSAGDWKERERWDDYQKAYEDALTKTNTAYAPWHIVPADRKWARNHIVLETIVDTLRPYRDIWIQTLHEMGEKARAELDEFKGRRHETD